MADFFYRGLRVSPEISAYVRVSALTSLRPVRPTHHSRENLSGFSAAPVGVTTLPSRIRYDAPQRLQGLHARRLSGEYVDNLVP